VGVAGTRDTSKKKRKTVPVHELGAQVGYVNRDVTAGTKSIVNQ
jgi:hypothetical protein